MNYSISDLEKISGIQSHTIRIWERRYRILKPLRTLGNTRKYDEKQLKKLLNIAVLNKSGLKISEISKLSPTDVRHHIEKVQKARLDVTPYDFIISQILNYGFEFDENKIEVLLDRFINQFGLADCYKNILLPILTKLGFMWLKDNICASNEHFLVNIFRQKILATIDALPNVQGNSKTWLLFLPKQENHDIGLLFAKFMLKKSNQNIVYLGADVPLLDLKKLITTKKINHIMLFMTKFGNVSETQSYLENLEELTQGVPIYVSGNRDVLAKVNYPKAVTWLETISQFEGYLQNQPTV